MTEFVVNNVQFVEGAVEFSFMRLPDDVRNGGQLVATRTLSVAEDHPSYVDEITELRDLVLSLVTDIYDDFDSAPIHTPEEDEDDDEKGMGE